MLADRRREMLVQIMRLSDLALLCTAFLIALAIGSGSFDWTSFSEILFIRVALPNLLLFMGYLALCSAVFSAYGFYSSHRLSHWNRRLREILLAVTVITGILLSVRRLLHFAFATDVFLFLFWSVNVCGLFALRETTYFALHVVRLRGRNLRNIVVIGEEPNATALAQRVRQEVGLGYQVLRIIDAREMTQWSNHN
jgi:FlaA1/EpsC-like NDP-sugar epimerase